MCDCWGCRTGNGHGATEPKPITVGATADDRKAWVECAAGQFPDQLDVTQIVPAYEAIIKALEAALSKALTDWVVVGNERDALAAQVAALQSAGDRLYNAASRAREARSWTYGIELVHWSDAAVASDKAAARYLAALPVAQELDKSLQADNRTWATPATWEALDAFCKTTRT